MNQLIERQTKIQLIGAILLLLALVSMMACSGSAAGELQDTNWQLVALHGNDLIPGTTITITFSGDTVSGSAGCNHYEGRYETSGDSLVLSDLFWTEMGCMDPAGILEQETEYLTTLSGAGKFQLADDQLEFFSEAGENVLVFNNNPD